MMAKEMQHSRDDRDPSLLDRTMTGPGLPSSGVLPAEPEIGDIIGGRFRLIDRLGHGGSGVVFKVIDLDSNTTLALKLLRAPRAHRSGLIKSEFRAVRDVAHSNLVSVHELFVEGDSAYLTMDFVDGVPIDAAAENARQDGRWDTLRHLFAQCAAGVQALHAHGVLHRDLKPSNVVVDGNDRVTILDFGLADHDGTRCPGAGTPMYMAPEQRTGQRLTQAADWFALGCMLHEAVTKGLAPGVLSWAAETSIPGDLLRLGLELMSVDSKGRPPAQTILNVLSGADDEAPAQVSEFVGRSRELSELTDALSATSRGHPQGVFVRGAPGTGKSALVRTFLRAQSDAKAAVVLRSACCEFENVLFNAFDGIVENLVSVFEERELPIELAPGQRTLVGRLFPSLQNVLAFDGEMPRSCTGQLPRELRRVGFQAFVELLVVASGDRPLVLWIDDLQWADEDSVELLRILVSSHANSGDSPSPGILIIGCAHDSDGPLGFETALLESSWQASTIHLKPLSEEDCREMALTLCDGNADCAQELIRESGGSPLLLEQLAALGTVEPAGLTIDRSIGLRTAALPEPDCALLELISSYTGPVPRRVAWQLAAITGGSLRGLCARRLCLWRRGGALDVYHGRIRTRVYTALEHDQRQARHRDIYKILKAWETAPFGLLAEHAHRAGMLALAFDHAQAAAANATHGLAFEQAARWLDLCLSLPPSVLSPDREIQTRRMLASTLAAAGQEFRAAEQYLQLADTTDRRHALDLRLRGAEQLLLSRAIDGGFTVLDRVLGELGVTPPKTALGTLVSLIASRLRLRFSKEHGSDAADASYASLYDRVDALAAGASGYMTTDALRGAWFASQQLIWAQKSRDPSRLVRALVNEALYLANEGAANADALDAAVRRGRCLAAAGGSESRGLVALASGMGALLLGQWQQAEAELKTAEGSLTEPEVERWRELTMCRKCRSLSMWFTGRVAELETSVNRWYEDAIERGDTASVRAFSVERPLFAIFADRKDRARALLEETQAVLAKGRFDQHRVAAIHTRTRYELYCDGSPERLLNVVEEYRPFWRSMMTRGQLLRTLSRFYTAQLLLAVSLSQGGDRRLLARARPLTHRLRDEGTAYAAHCASLLEAAIQTQVGNVAAARRILSAVAQGLREDGQPLFAAGAKWQLGLLTASARGRALVVSAEGSMTELGVENPTRMVRLLTPGFLH